MEIADINIHQDCVNFDCSKNSLIESFQVTKGNRENSKLSYNLIHFVMEGKVKYSAAGFAGCEASKGRMIFLPAGKDYTFEALEDTSMVVIHIHSLMNICDNSSLEDIYQNNINTSDNPVRIRRVKRFGNLKINNRILHYINGLKDTLDDGVRCKSWMQIKIKEFFFMLRVYYDEKEIYDFLLLILSNNVAFSEHIRMNWQRYSTVAEMAQAMNCTTKQLAARFKQVFGKTPNRWMIDTKANQVYQEIVSSDNGFKEIAIKNGFDSSSSFTRFCRMEFNRTPTQIRSEESA